MQEEVNNATKKAGKVAKNLANKIDNVESELTGESTARETVTKLTDNVTDLAQEYIGNFNSSPLDFIRQYPVQAALGGVVLGYILGMAVAKKAVTE